MTANLTKLLAILLLSVTSTLAQAVEEGDVAPAFSLPTLDQSGEMSLASTNGKVRYLDFWASWCAPCRVSLPQIVDLQADLGGENFEVIAINVDEDRNDAIRFLKRYSVNYTILSDTTGETAAQYKLPGMPTSFVLDTSGEITLRHTGFKKGDMDMIRGHIEALIAEAGE